MTTNRTPARAEIERIWRNVHKLDNLTTLGISDNEWAFLEALYNATPISDRTLARYNYTNESTRSQAMTAARTEHDRIRADGERNIQWRNINDDRGTAYVVERLG